GLAIIYALSRIYLSIPAHAATILAALVALGIIGIAGYVATNPKMPPWQLSTMITGVLAIFAVGFIYAGIHGKNEHFTAVASETPSAGQTPTGPGAPALTIVGKNVKFDITTATIPGGQVTIRFDNQDTGVVHNLHLFRGTSATGESVGATAEAPGPDVADLTVDLTQGTYFYHCD